MMITDPSNVNIVTKLLLSIVRFKSMLECTIRLSPISVIMKGVLFS